VVELQLPKGALIVMINREGKYLTASGETLLQAGDHLLIMTDNKETAQQVASIFN
jgi:cell volume regulation protein A